MVDQIDCKACGETKPTTDFYKDKYTKRGYKARCKDCTKNKKVRYQPYGKKEEYTEPSDEKADSNEIMGSIMGPVDTNYPQFDFNEKFTKGKHYSAVLVASRNSGKTTLIKSFFPFLRGQYDRIIVFSNSLQAEIYEDFFSKEEEKFIFDKYDPLILKELEKLQKHTRNAFHFCIIFDDCVSMKQKHSDSITQLYTRGRNMNMTIIFSTQSPMFVDSDSRGNIDFLFILKIRTPSMKDKVITHFLMHTVPIPKEYYDNGKPPKKTVMEMYYQRWLKENTKDHNVVILDYLNDDQIYHYKANV